MDQSPPHPSSTNPTEVRRLQAREVLSRLEELSRALHRLRTTLARAAQLRLPAYALLELLAQAENPRGLTVSEAAHHLGVRPQALSPLAAELEGHGFLQRQTDPSDARARRLLITPRGHQRLARAQRLLHHAQDAILQQVPAPNVALLVLDKLNTALRSLGG